MDKLYNPMSYECNFCGSVFSKECNLSTHKKSAKYCLTIQGSKTITSNICLGCDKTFNHTSSLIKHRRVCKGLTIRDLNTKFEKLEKGSNKIIRGLNIVVEDLEVELKETKEKVKELEDTIIDLRLKLAEDKGQIKVYKERPTPTINNNYINPKLLQVKCDTIRPFTIETVREDVQAGKFTFERFIKAEKGLIEFISDIITQDTEFSYVCTDSSRQKFHRLLESREWKDDNGATFLNKVLDELKEPATTHYRRITDMMVTGDRDTADFLREKTKPMVMGITCPSSKDRDATFAKIRNEVKNLATI